MYAVALVTAVTTNTGNIKSLGNNVESPIGGGGGMGVAKLHPAEPVTGQLWCFK